MPTIKNFPNNADEYIGAENVMKWLHGRTSGVFGAEDNLAVTADDGLSVSVSDGIGWIANDEADGTVFWNDYEQENGTKLSLPIELPDAIFPRIDRVVVSWETINYVAKPSIEILKGTAASSPVPPSLTNDNLKRQISLAQIYVPGAASKISSENITDERLDPEVCGLVTESLSVDTSMMKSQFEALLKLSREELENLRRAIAEVEGDTAWMLKALYDTNNRRTDVYDYADETAQTHASAAAADAIKQLEAVIYIRGAGAHNSIYRGKNLGSAVTAEQYAAIQAGTFDDMYIGDYWTISGVNYRIAAFDYYYRTGDTECTTHHVTLVPDAPMYEHAMNDSSVTTGGYVGSKMYTTGLADAKRIINNAFGSAHILTHRQYLCNAVSNGKPSGSSWYDSTVELMTEQNVYGGKVFVAGNDGSTVPALDTVDKSQYPLFAFRPDLISNRTTFWLRDVASAAYFALVSYAGYAAYYYASNDYSVRPAFSIKS